MLLLTHESFLAHDTGHGHPEHAGRLEAVIGALDDAKLPDLGRQAPPLGTAEQILLAHPRRHFDGVLDLIPAAGRAGIDADTIVSQRSGEAALHAVGAVCAGVDHAFSGAAAPRAFCAVRPPGHHAEGTRAMGFCLFNSIAVGAHWALDRELAGRVAILDFDVHHGNGTQDIFWDEGRVLFASSHQFPLYPGTGSADEQGSMKNILNAPLAPGTGGAAFREAWGRLFDGIDRFEPDLILVSAGFDAHRLDPLADLDVGTADYSWISEQILALAQAHAHGRVVSALEGGYSLTALREAVPEYLRAQA
ncbi:MAG: histone deacetylase family protein [Pseudomonadota bacterium]